MRQIFSPFLPEVFLPSVAAARLREFPVVVAASGTVPFLTTGAATEAVAALVVFFFLVPVPPRLFLVTVALPVIGSLDTVVVTAPG